MKARTPLPRLRFTDRKSLLLGTALASTLFIGSVLAPKPAHAVTNCLTGNPPPGPITTNVADSIICINVDDRFNVGPAVIRLQATGGNHYIELLNSGILTNINPAGYANGLAAATSGGNSPISVTNAGRIFVDAQSYVYGITVGAANGSSPVSIQNGADIMAKSAASTAVGLEGITNNGLSPLSIVNSGDISVTAALSAKALTATTNNGFSPVSVVNSGDLDATSSGGPAIGISVETSNGNSPFSIVNSGAIAAAAGSQAYGIRALANDPNSPLSIVNSGDLAATGVSAAAGIFAQGGGDHNNLSIENSGNIVATSGLSAYFALGIFAQTRADNIAVAVNNSGDITAAAGTNAAGIVALTNGANGNISIFNSGDITASHASQKAAGLYTHTSGDGSGIAIENSGNLTTTQLGSSARAYGIHAVTDDANSRVDVKNSAEIAVTGGGFASGIYAATFGDNAPIGIVNSGALTANAVDQAFAISALTNGINDPLSIVNSGDLVATGAFAAGIFAQGAGSADGISIDNSGDIKSAAANTGMGLAVGLFAQTQASDTNVAIKNSGDISVDSLGRYAGGIVGMTYGDNSTISIVNSGNITASRSAVIAAGIYSHTYGTNSGIAIENSGDLSATGLGKSAGILARATGPNSPVSIVNSGSVYGGYAGIFASSLAGTTIVNTGNISAGSQLAINVGGATAEIYNAGHITGYVILDADDTFINQSGGVFETKLTSDFGPGSDLFRNEAGGTVLAAINPNTSEHSSFVNLERFENQGLITMQDGQAGDSFEISNTVGSRDLKFVASGNSALGVDAFLGGPGSISDTFTINGDVSGKTEVKVDNTNPGLGVLNKTGIPVVYVNGNVNSDAFYLNKPIETGFFNYDLFFRPTGSGVFELKSFLGQSAFVLPQLETAAQDLWHEASSTWFDRTADLRVLLNGGAAPAEDPNAKYAEGTPSQPNITPAVWVRASGSSLDRDVSANVTAYDRDYRYNLNRNLETVDFQGGIDLGKRGLLSDDDMLVFGALGGFVHADLDYDAINRLFSSEGGQVGGYATYLRGGLFVDTLLDVHLLQIDTKTLGFPNSLDTTTVGLRTDSGYRFGSFKGGAFIEPLATISLTWADINGFTQGGNKVSFNDDPNVRGRLGLRVGTSIPVWAGTTMEPFVIGSVWGNLSDNNEATLVSTGTTFHLEDQLEDVWGEVSAGVNFFNPSANTSVFAKADVTYGDNLDGIGGKAGMRVSW